MSCHQLGNKATREIPAALGKFESGVAAWARRVASGHDGSNMDGQLSSLGRQRALKMFADWTDRIAAGEYPKEAPPRPQGRRAQSRHHAVGLGRSSRVLPRRDRERQAKSHRHAVRTGVRAPRELVRSPDDPRSGEELVVAGHDSVQPDSDAESRGARDAESVAVLGRRDHLEPGDQRTQQRDRSERPRLEHDENAHGHGTPGLLQGRIEQSVREGVSDWRRRARWRRSSVHRLRSVRPRRSRSWTRASARST